MNASGLDALGHMVGLTTLPLSAFLELVKQARQLRLKRCKLSWGGLQWSRGVCDISLERLTGGTLRIWQAKASSLCAFESCQCYWPDLAGISLDFYLRILTRNIDNDHSQSAAGGQVVESN